MNRMIKYGLILGCVLAGMSACIDDNSKGAHIPLSYITIETEEDTIYNDYGSVQAIKPRCRNHSGKRAGVRVEGSLYGRCRGGRER